MKSQVRTRPITEETIAEAVDALFRRRGYVLTRQLRIRTWRPDLVAVRNDEVVIVETKGQHGDLRKALARTALYATDGTAAYLALPAERVTGRLKGSLRALGIGLIEVGEEARVLVPARIGKPRPALVERARRAAGQPTEPIPPARRPRGQPLGRVLRHRRLLEALLANPERRFTIRELSLEARTPYATTWRTVEELRALGALTAERVGTSQYLSVNLESPLTRDLERLRSLELSPHRGAARAFASRLAKVPQVRKAILFGSAAEGREEAGSDVDVAILLTRKSKPLMERIYRIVSEIQDLTRMRVVPLPITSSEFEARGRLGEAIRAGEVLYERP